MLFFQHLIDQVDKKLSNDIKDMNNILNKIQLLSIYMQLVTVKYQFSEDKHEMVLPFPRTSFCLLLQISL